MIYIYVVLLLIIILKSSQAWWFLDMPNFLLLVIYGLTIVAGEHLLSRGKKYHLNISQISFLSIFILASFVYNRGFNMGLVFTIALVVVIAQIMMMDKQWIRKILDYINNIMFVVILLSTTTYILYFIGVPIPSIGQRTYLQYWGTDYLFFVDSSQNYLRFGGFTLEPGYMGTLVSLLLLINNYKKDIKTVTYLVALFFTFSLGGWIMTAVSWFIHYSISNSKSAPSIILRAIVFVGLFVGFSYFSINIWNNGDNLVNELIFYRLTPDEERGFVGNSRQTDELDIEWSRFLKSEHTILGYGSELYNQNTFERYNDWGGAGYKTFIMRYGFLITLLMLLAFFSYYRSMRNHKVLLPAMILFVLDWLQHTGAFSPTFILLYLCFEINQVFVGQPSRVIRIHPKRLGSDKLEQ